MTLKTTRRSTPAVAPKHTPTTKGATSKPAGKTAATAWAPKATATKTSSTVGWTNKDGAKNVAGEFKAQGDGFQSFTLKADHSFSARTTDGQTLQGQFGLGHGGAAFGDTFTLKGPNGSLRLFSVDTVTRDAKGKVMSMQLAEFKNGSPTDLQPMTLTRN